MIRNPTASRVPAHAFERDLDVPLDHQRRAWCLWCHLPGRAGDDRHPQDAGPLRPPADPDAIDLDARILGEAPREGATP